MTPLSRATGNRGASVALGRVILVGNEKGGAGKSTIAAHLAVCLLHEGARVAVLDLDARQQSTGHFFVNRAAWSASQGVAIPLPVSVAGAPVLAELPAVLAQDADFIVVDTPGADTDLSRAAHGLADVIVTPMNDSFVDFDVLGVVDPVTLNVVRPSLYAETVWQARKGRAARGGHIDWVVLRNRLAPVEARNRRRVDERLAVLARRVGFRPVAGLRDRVIYRELFPFGLTVSDLSRHVRPVKVGLGHVVARQELRTLLRDLDLIGEAPSAAVG